MKQEWEAVLSYYPAFKRVLGQYDNAQTGGSFVYDTGYLYLLGKADNSFLICLLFLSICMVIAFYNGISMEYSRKAWYLLGAIRCGKKAIIRDKAVLVAICAAIMAVLPWIFRTIGIARVFPMSGLLTTVTNIPALADFPLHIPLIWFIVGMIVVQQLSVVCGQTAVLSPHLRSLKRPKYIQYFRLFQTFIWGRISRCQLLPIYSGLPLKNRLFRDNMDTLSPKGQKVC